MRAPALAFLVLTGCLSFGAPPKFEKVSDHCYFLPLNGGAENIFAVVTDEGTLIVDPPSEPGLSVTMEALKRLNAKAVRWVTFSNPRSADSAGARFFAEQGAALLGGSQLRTLAASIPGADQKGPAARGGTPEDLSSFPWMIFDRQIHLFPANLEVRILALQHRARTGGDVFVFLPAEKVLFVGGLCEAGRYPEIDSGAQGNAGEWIDGLKQVVDSIPVLKPAIQPQVKVDPTKALPEKTLEEGIVVVSARGEASNFQNMKDLLSACQKLRTDISKAVKSGRSCENFLSSSRADLYRVYENFDAYGAQLCESLSAAPDK